MFVASLFEVVIVKPIFNLLVLIYGILPGHNFGLSIILFTIIVRLLMWPLVKKQLHQAKAMRALQPELKRIKKEAVGVRELNKAKKQIEGRVFLYLETSDDIASFYGDEELLKGEIETPQEYIKKIMRVTIGDIQSVANDVFFNKRATLALIGPHKNASLFQNILAKL